MDITVEDIAQMSLELWMAKRDAARLLAQNADLQRQLDETKARPAEPDGPPAGEG